MISVLSYRQYDPRYYALHNEPKGGVRRNYVKIPKKKDLELIFTWIHIMKHMSSQINVILLLILAPTLNQPIFELQTCYLQKNWSEFHQKLIYTVMSDPRTAKYDYDGSFCENLFFLIVFSANPRCTGDTMPWWTTCPSGQYAPVDKMPRWTFGPQVRKLPRPLFFHWHFSHLKGELRRMALFALRTRLRRRFLHFWTKNI